MADQHYSLDIETLDTESTAVVLSVGICLFTKEGPIGPMLHVGLDVNEQIAAGRTISHTTFMWWVEQLISMDTSPFPPEAYTVKGALQAIREYMVKAERACGGGRRKVWSKGPHFDHVIMESLHKMVGERMYCDYGSVRDQRTFCKQEKLIPLTDVLVEHNALGDAVTQAHHIQQICKNFILELC